jgi:hypothetical protein
MSTTAGVHLRRRFVQSERSTLTNVMDDGQEQIKRTASISESVECCDAVRSRCSFPICRRVSLQLKRQKTCKLAFHVGPRPHSCLLQLRHIFHILTAQGEQAISSITVALPLPPHNVLARFVHDYSPGPRLQRRRLPPDRAARRARRRPHRVGLSRCSLFVLSPTNNIDGPSRRRLTVWHAFVRLGGHMRCGRRTRPTRWCCCRRRPLRRQ